MREQPKEVTEHVKTLVCAKKTSARGKHVWDELYMCFPRANVFFSHTPEFSHALSLPLLALSCLFPSSLTSACSLVPWYVL